MKQTGGVIKITLNSIKTRSNLETPHQSPHLLLELLKRLVIYLMSTTYWILSLFFMLFHLAEE